MTATLTGRRLDAVRTLIPTLAPGELRITFTLDEATRLGMKVTATANEAGELETAVLNVGGLRLVAATLETGQPVDVENETDAGTHKYTLWQSSPGDIQVLDFADSAAA